MGAEIKLGERGPLRRWAGRWTVVLVTMTPSMPLTVLTASAMSSSPCESRSGDILRTSFGRRVDSVAVSSRAWTTPRRRFSNSSRCCRPLISGVLSRREARVRYRYAPEARRVGAGHVDDEHVGLGSECTDANNEVFRRFLWACFILAQVHCQQSAVTQGSRILLGS